ncbi:hypothetical protein HBP99_04105 [Listeria booriae]|uniref:hypothetical protein n=1 Tax=Listeria booriae TaxID=1552123 RepID=UPI00162810AD|nr:hypothetical protein [Listeria booriae]MBC2367803.1 hypothetical protein [Listeria booriae]
MMKQKNVEEIDFITDSILENSFDEAVTFEGAELFYFITLALEGDLWDHSEESLEFIRTLEGQRYFLSELTRKFIERC